MAVSPQRSESCEGFEPYTLNGVQVTDRELGRGSYAAAVELEYKGLKCAGKKIFQAIQSSQGVRNALQRFVKECRLLSQMRHPNVVQFLGVHLEKQVPIPILVMEFLPTNLSSCIDQYGILPKEISYSILHDVSLGLNYLHSQTLPIIHRNLSANNVLLTSNMTAKISDLGVAKILDLTPLQMSSMTETPGTPTYMPPEVMVANPKYDTSVDVFSYGIMMIHVFSGKWPHPKFNQVHVGSDGQLIPVSEAERREEYLRNIGQDHPLMDLILSCINNHPLQRCSAPEIVQRLKDAVLQFPPSFANKVEMLSRIEAVEGEKERLTQEYVTEVEQLQSEVSDISAQIEMIASEKNVLKSKKIVQNSKLKKIFNVVFYGIKECPQRTPRNERKAFDESEVTKIVQLVCPQISETAIQECTRLGKYTPSKHRPLCVTFACFCDTSALLSNRHRLSTLPGITIKPLMSSEERETEKMLLHERRRLIDDRGINKSIIKLKGDTLFVNGKKHYFIPQSGFTLHSQALQSKITWKPCTDLPTGASTGQNTVINGKVYYKMYVSDSEAPDPLEIEYSIIYCYDPSQDTWSTLPPLPVKDFGLGQVRGQLVAMGGMRISDRKASNEVYVFEEGSKKWNQPLPSMPTARCSPAVISLPSALIVAGGSTMDALDVSTVEIFDTVTSKWHRTDSLLTPCRDMSPVIIGDTCYLVGGIAENDKETLRLNQVVCALIDQLIHNITATPLNEISLNQDSQHISAWKKLANTPIYFPTAAVIANTILSIGGSTGEEFGTGGVQRSVYMYSPSTDSWIYIADLPGPRVGATAAVLSPTEILVIGGWDGDCVHNTVYKGTFTLST